MSGINSPSPWGGGQGGGVLPPALQWRGGGGGGPPPPHWGGGQGGGVSFAWCSRFTCKLFVAEARAAREVRRQSRELCSRSWCVSYEKILNTASGRHGE